MKFLEDVGYTFCGGVLFTVLFSTFMAIVSLAWVLLLVFIIR